MMSKDIADYNLTVGEFLRKFSRCMGDSSYRLNFDTGKTNDIQHHS
jgi:hypothetical protein